MAGKYDRLFKSLAEDDPRGILHLFGSLPPDSAATVAPLDRELGLPVLAVDHVYRLQDQTREWVVHFEAQTRYEPDVPERLCRYAASLALKFRLPIETVLVMLVERHAPVSFPAAYRAEFGAFSMELRYRIVKLWELDGEEVFARARPRLFPWVILMRSTQELLQRVAEAILRLRDRELAAQFRVLGGLRYDRERVEELLGRVGFMLSDEIIKESSFYREILEEGLAAGRSRGVAEGLAEGRAEGRTVGLADGRAEEARRLVARIVERRFPEIAFPSQIAARMNAEALEALFDQLVIAENAEAARLAIANAMSA